MKGKKGKRLIVKSIRNDSPLKKLLECELFPSIEYTCDVRLCNVVDIRILFCAFLYHQSFIGLITEKILSFSLVFHSVCIMNTVCYS